LLLNVLLLRSVAVAKRAAIDQYCLPARPTAANTLQVAAGMDGARFKVPLDTKCVISGTFFPANLLARYRKKPHSTKLTTKTKVI